MLSTDLSYVGRCPKTVFQLELAFSVMTVTTEVAETPDIPFKEQQRLSIPEISCSYEGRDTIAITTFHIHFPYVIPL